jgi:hypothetical protein
MLSLTELPGTADNAEDGTRKLWANKDKFFGKELEAAKVLMLWNSDTAGIMRPVGGEHGRGGEGEGRQREAQSHPARDYLFEETGGAGDD